MLKLLNVSREYELDEETVLTPLKEVSLTIEKGDFIMVIGRSGSGKTTMLNLAAGLIHPSSGQVLFEDRDYEKMNDRELSRLRCEKMGFVFQFPSLLPSLTVTQNIVLPTSFGKKIGKEEALGRAASLLEMVGLSAKTHVYPRQLSAGEQRRVVIARALINKPDLLLADEPTSDLDESTEQEIMALLDEIHRSGVTILMVTHSLQLLPSATRVFKMEKSALSPLSEGDRILASFTGGVSPILAKE